MKRTLWALFLGISFLAVALWQGFGKIDAVMKQENPFFGDEPAFSVDVGEREICVFGQTHSWDA